MKKGNQIEMDHHREHDIKMKKMGKMSTNDFLLILVGAAAITVFALLLSWIFM